MHKTTFGKIDKKGTVMIFGSFGGLLGWIMLIIAAPFIYIMLKEIWAK